MEYQDIINLLDNAPNQPSEFRTKKWIEITQKRQDVYGNIIEMNQFWLVPEFLIISLVRVIRLNLNKK